MPTHCNGGQFEFEALGSRKVTAEFDGGILSRHVV
jgi:hypothetical protein